MLLFVTVIGLTIWNIQLRRAQQVTQPQPQNKTAPTVVRHVYKKMEVASVRHKVNIVTETALNEIGLSLDNSVRVFTDVVGFQPPPYYDCYLLGNISKNNTVERTIMSFRLAKNFSITSLTVNGKPIALPEPIYGLPLGEDGLMKDIHLVIWCGAWNDFTNNGDVGNGYIKKDVVLKGERLTVVLKREGTFISHKETGFF